MDRPGDYHTKWNESEKDKYHYDTTYIWNLKMMQMNLFTKQKQILDIENKPMVAKGERRVSSVQFCCSVVSDSLQPYELQHARLPCPSPTPGVHSNSRPLSRWCHPAISSSVVPFSSCPQTLPASESFPISQLFSWGGQSIRVSALESVLPKNTQDWSPLEWTGWISLQSKGLSSLLQHHSSKALSLLYGPTLTSIHDHWKIHSFD